MRIDSIPKEFLPGNGHLLLGPSPGSEVSPRDADLAQIVALGVHHVVCLQEESELDRCEPPETIAVRRQAVEALGMEFSHFPIEDFEAPTLDQAWAVVGLLTAELEAGRTVYLHCQAGLGRAGTLAACLLVTGAQPLAATGAIAMVRYARDGAIQSAAQEEFIAAFAAAG